MIQMPHMAAGMSYGLYKEIPAICNLKGEGNWAVYFPITHPTHQGQGLEGQWTQLPSCLKDQP